jgi:hypothetical protein
MSATCRKRTAAGFSLFVAECDGEGFLLLQGWAAALPARQRGCCTPSARKAGR